MVMMTRFKTLALISLCLGLALAGCGRKGSLDDPSAPTPTADAGADPAVVAASEPTEQPEDDKPFFLDFLIQ